MNYSLADQINGVGLTPLGEEVLRDPRAMQRMSNDLATMSAYGEGPGLGFGELFPEEPGGATGQFGATTYAATPEDDQNVVLSALQTVIGAPFNILRGGKELLEDAIGHPNSYRRMEEERFVDAMGVVGDTELGAVGMPVDRSGINARQAGGSEIGTGVGGGTTALMQPKRSWLPDLITGEQRKRRQRMMADLQAALKAQDIHLNVEALKSGIYKDVATGTNAMASANQTNLQTDYLRRYGDADWQAKIDAQRANAEQSRAGAFNQTQQGITHREMRPHQVSGAQAEALNKWSAGQRADDQYWNIQRGALEDERAQKAAESDVRIKEAIAKIEDRDLRSAAYVDAMNRAAADRARRTDADVALKGQQGLLVTAQTGTERFRQEKLDAQTKAISDYAAANLDKIAAQIGTFSDSSKLLQARTRVEDIRAGALMNREDRDNAMAEVKRAVLETKMDLARQAQTTSDLIAKTKINFILKDIERLESVISLNYARESAVGLESSGGAGGGGGGAFGRALLSQAGKESNANLNALLGSASDNVGTVYDRANRWELLGFEPGRDFGIVRGDKPGWPRSLWSQETPDRIVFPKGSRLRGAAKGVQENAPAARIMTEKPAEKTAEANPAFDDEPAAVRPEVANGQTSRAMNGRTAEILRTYPTAKAIVAAQKSGAITLEEGAKALDALGVARRPRT
jgi:hypothetical protein